MADNEQTNRTVTIDADYFAQLYRKANETDEICKECCAEHTAEEFNALVKERDELQAKMTRIVETNEHTSRSLHDQCCKLKSELAYRKDELDRAYDELKSVKENLANIIKDCVQYERITEILQDTRKLLEAERADKLKVITELNDVRELNRKCCDENDELKEKLENANKHYCTSATGNKAGDACVVAKRCQDLEAELKAANETNSAQADQLRDALNALERERMNKCDEVTVKRLADAERCIYAVKENLIFDKSNPDDYFDQFRTATNTALKIIKNFIEKREVK